MPLSPKRVLFAFMIKRILKSQDNVAGRGGVGWGHDTLLHCYYQTGDVLLVSIIVCVDGEQSHDTEFIYKF